MSAHTFVVAIGSNFATKHIEIKEAIEWLKSQSEHIVVSSLYTTIALNGKSPDYLNAVAICRLSLSELNYIDTFNIKLKSYEQSRGRTIDLKKEGIVPIDIDIVICDDVVLRPKDYVRNYFIKGYNELKKNKPSGL